MRRAPPRPIRRSSRSAPASLLWRSWGAASFSATGPPSSVHCGRALVLARDHPALRHRDPGASQQLLRLDLVQPAVGVRPGVRIARPSRTRGGGGDRPQAARVPGVEPQRPRAGQRRSQARHHRHAVIRQLAAGRVVDQVGEGGGDQGGGLGLRGAGDDPGPDRGPGGSRLRRQALGVVIEDQELVDRGVGADGDRDPAQQVGVAPDHRRVVERVADRRRRGQELRQFLAGPSGQLGQPRAEAGGLVGGDAGVAARAGQDREPAVAPRPGAPLGQNPGELQQLVRIRGPDAAGLLDQGAEHPLVARDRARVRGGGPRPRLGGAHLQHRHPDITLGAARERLGKAQRRRRPPPGTAPPSGRPRARRSPPASRWRRGPLGCRWRGPCGSGSRGASRAR